MAGIERLGTGASHVRRVDVILRDPEQLRPLTGRIVRAVRGLVAPHAAVVVQQGETVTGPFDIRTYSLYRHEAAMATHTRVAAVVRTVLAAYDRGRTTC